MTSHRVALLVSLAGAALAADGHLASPPPLMSQARDTLPRARAVIERHVAAIGGAAALAKIRSRYIWASYDVPARRVRASVQVYAARPDKRLIKILYPDVGSEVTGFDGVHGWTVSASGAAKLLGPRQVAELRDQSQFDFDLHPDSLYRSMETVQETDFEGRRCYMLKLVSSSQRTWYEYYDVKTGLFAGSVAPHETEREPVTLRTIVTDYGEYDGVRLPSRIVLRSAGVEEMVRVREVKDDGVDASIFDLPAALRRAAGQH